MATGHIRSTDARIPSPAPAVASGIFGGTRWAPTGPSASPVETEHRGKEGCSANDSRTELHGSRKYIGNSCTSIGFSRDIGTVAKSVSLPTPLCGGLTKMQAGFRLRASRGETTRNGQGKALWLGAGFSRSCTSLSLSHIVVP